MQAGVPERMVEGAIRLLAKHGFQAASFGAVLQASGLNAQQAGDMSMMILAACEGAVVLCRAERSFDPLDTATA